jgi:hypothetical protein
VSTYEFDTGGVERLVGQLKAVGGTTGDVPTQLSSGLLSQAPGGGSMPLQFAERSFTSAEILAFAEGSPYQIGPTPDAGTALLPMMFTLAYTAGLTPYTDNGGQIVLVTVVGGSEWMSETTAGFWDQATSQAVFGLGPLQITLSGGLSVLSDYDGAPLLIVANGVTDPTGGDGTLDVTVAYMVVPLA